MYGGLRPADSWEDVSVSNVLLCTNEGLRVMPPEPTSKAGHDGVIS